MAFHKAYIGCRPEAQYTYYEGCFLAIRVGHEGAHAARAPSTRDAAEGAVSPDEWGRGQSCKPRTPVQDHVPTLWVELAT